MDTIIPRNSPQKKLNGYQEYYGSVHTVFLYTSREKPCHSNNRRLATKLLYSKDPIERCCTLRQDAMIMNNKVKEFSLTLVRSRVRY